ncbi:peptidase C19 family protein [Planoprotostelium fungivorum]|uniref:Ubiquitin carboxyl-terminal hydrolase n=1 Tax=Planoprotostelium fungivorum TaxID=1890364 RepID=A0A2P6NKC4_9EUKA|nr:peptidase C19 family protein [Planoprotostelium fungivorum]
MVTSSTEERATAPTQKSFQSVAEKLKNSQGNDILDRRIIFKRAQKEDQSTSILRAKYKPINAKSTVTEGTTNGKGKASNGDVKRKAEDDSHGDDVVEPQYSLFPLEDIKKMIQWTKILRAGPGLDNMGNTCFLNSVIQCLTYTPPLANFLMSRKHSQSCKINGFCMFCVLEKHIIRVFQNTKQSSITPQSIVTNLRSLSKQFKLGRQEDSHEFLRYVLEGMQKSSLHGLQATIGKVDGKIAETSIVHRIFGGYLQSQVKCTVCQYKSNTFDPFLDLSLEIKNCVSLEKALHAFTSIEVLNGANKYKCSKCMKYVDAHKRFTIRKIPHVLTIQLKRFTFQGSFGGKIQKPVSYPETLDMKPYLDPRCVAESGSCQYKLYAVLVHSGESTRSGHYFAYVKSPAGIWNLMNDSQVQQINASRVLEQKAYILFYVKDTSNDNAKNAPLDNLSTIKKKGKNDNLQRAQMEEKKKREEKTQLDNASVVEKEVKFSSLETPRPKVQVEDEEGFQLFSKKKSKVEKSHLTTNGSAPSTTSQKDSANTENNGISNDNGNATEKKKEPTTKEGEAEKGREKKKRVIEVVWGDEEGEKMERNHEREKKYPKLTGELKQVLTVKRNTLFGTDVATWDGEISREEDQILSTERETVYNRKRHADDIEYDKGRVKKVKTKKEELDYNIFQKEVNKRLTGKKSIFVPPHKALKKGKSFGGKNGQGKSFGGKNGQGKNFGGKNGHPQKKPFNNNQQKFKKGKKQDN